MIPIKTIDEVIDYCNNNTCGKCLLDIICDKKNERVLFNTEEELSHILSEIVIHNRKEKLKKLLA